MNEFWQIFIKDTSLAALLIAGSAWVIRKVVDNFFSNKIEQYKSQLEKENIKYRITYEKLHAERAEVIKNMYAKLVKTEDAVTDYVKPMRDAREPKQEEYGKIVSETFNDFSKYYSLNKIFFSDPIAKKLDSILKLLLQIANDFQISRMVHQEKPSHASVSDWLKIYEKLKNEVPPLKTDIENEFRELIGITDSLIKGR